MLERPDIPDERLRALLEDAYGRTATRLAFLPIGDTGSAIYRVATADGTELFLKLRTGSVDRASIAVPAALAAAGIDAVLAPVLTLDGLPWAAFEGFTALLYPFVEGGSGFRVPLSDVQWISFGRAVRRIQDVALPDEVRDQVPIERYDPRWRTLVASVMAGLDGREDRDPDAQRLAGLLRDRRAEIAHVVDRSGGLAGVVANGDPATVLCHADLHAGNILVGRDGSFRIVDWDAPIRAPKERDLMFVGAGVGGVWNAPREDALFYRGYGPADIDATALVYYRYERIVEDIGVTCEQIFGSTEGGDDRARGIRQLAVQFERGNVVEIAVRSDVTRLGTVPPAWGRV